MVIGLTIIISGKIWETRAKYNGYRPNHYNIGQDLRSKTDNMTYGILLYFRWLTFISRYKQNNYERSKSDYLSRWLDLTSWNEFTIVRVTDGRRKSLDLISLPVLDLRFRFQLWINNRIWLCYTCIGSKTRFIYQDLSGWIHAEMICIIKIDTKL